MKANPLNKKSRKLPAAKLFHKPAQSHGAGKGQNAPRHKDRRGKEKLGRGLSALFSSDPTLKRADLVASSASIVDLPVKQIIASKDQPRKYFNDEALAELADSIKQVGIIQPVIVRLSVDDADAVNPDYELIAGERRWRAAQLVGKKTIPAVIIGSNNEKIFEKMLIENIQREDLSPFEEATAYRVLMERKNLLQEQVARLVGKSRSHVANTLRLTKLPREVQSLLQAGQISFGIARALIGLDKKQMPAMLKTILENKLTVREVEHRVAAILAKKSPQSSLPRKGANHENDHRTSQNIRLVKELEAEFRKKLGCKVTIVPLKKNVGKLEIEYYSYDHLTQLTKKF
ncbi:chromosome-partitioning protein Spo0J [Spirochaetota bacterium]|nr:chromosome-partitioning protein Spo0J [Spirochaetota bacterium]